GGAVDTKIDLDYAYDFGGEVGGPIVKDKLWFHLGFNPSMAHSTVTRFVQTQVDKNQDGVPDVDPATGFTVHDPVSNSTYASTAKTYFFTAKLNGAVNQNNQFQISAFGNPSTSEGPVDLTRNPQGAQIEKDIGAYDLSAKWTSKLSGGKTEVDAVFGFHRGF